MYELWYLNDGVLEYRFFQCVYSQNLYCKAYKGACTAVSRQKIPLFIEYIDFSILASIRLRLSNINFGAKSAKFSLK